MKLTATSRWFKLDWGIIITCIILITISLATLYSLELNQENPNFSFLNRQMISAAICVLCFFILFMCTVDPPRLSMIGGLSNEVANAYIFDETFS